MLTIMLSMMLVMSFMPPILLSQFFKKVSLMLHLTNLKSYQHLIYDLLEFYKNVFQTKWQKKSLVQIILQMMINSSKCCFEFVTLSQWQLMITK
jgi:hypothetical protein